MPYVRNLHLFTITNYNDMAGNVQPEIPEFVNNKIIISNVGMSGNQCLMPSWTYRLLLVSKGILLRKKYRL